MALAKAYPENPGTLVLGSVNDYKVKVALLISLMSFAQSAT